MSTPTKADQIRGALEAASKALKAGNTVSPNDIWRAADKVNRALSLLADLDGGGEVVAWMSPNGVCISAKMRDIGMNDHGKELYSTPLYRHPSPTAADAPPEADRSKPQPSVDELMDELDGWLKTCGSPIPCHDEYMDDLRDRLTKKFNK